MSNTCLLIKNYFFNFIHKLFKNKKASGMILPVILLATLGFSALFSFLSYYSIVTVKNENPELAIYSFSTTGLMFAIQPICVKWGTNRYHYYDLHCCITLCYFCFIENDLFWKEHTKLSFSSTAAYI